jgi:hypothetical protein
VRSDIKSECDNYLLQTIYQQRVWRHEVSVIISPLLQATSPGRISPSSAIYRRATLGTTKEQQLVVNKTGLNALCLVNGVVWWRGLYVTLDKFT